MPKQWDVSKLGIECRIPREPYPDIVSDFWENNSVNAKQKGGFHEMLWSAASVPWKEKAWTKCDGCFWSVTGNITCGSFWHRTERERECIYVVDSMQKVPIECWWPCLNSMRSNLEWVMRLPSRVITLRTTETRDLLRMIDSRRNLGDPEKPGRQKLAACTYMQDENL